MGMAMCIEGLIEYKHQEYFGDCYDEYNQEKRKQYWCKVLKIWLRDLLTMTKRMIC